MGLGYKEKLALEKAEKELAKARRNLEAHRASLHGGSRALSLQSVHVLKGSIEADLKEIKRLEKKVENLR